MKIDFSDNLLDNRRFNIFDTVLSVAVNFFIVVMILLIAMYIAVEPVKISGASMENNLHDGQSVVVDKLYKKPKRGDVVVIKNGEERLIKRVVAVEGDKVGFVNERTDDKLEIHLYLDTGNGFELVQEDYIAEKMSFAAMGDFTRDILLRCEVVNSLMELESEKKYIEIDEGSFYALGDNRNVSRDSRHYGTFENANIVGKEFAVLSKDGFWENFFSLFYREASPANNH